METTASPNTAWLKWYALAIVAIVAIYWYYSNEQHKMMKAYYGVNYESVPDTGMASGNHASPPHRAQHEGSVVIFPHTDKEPGAE